MFGIKKKVKQMVNFLMEDEGADFDVDELIMNTNYSEALSKFYKEKILPIYQKAK